MPLKPCPNCGESKWLKSIDGIFHQIKCDKCHLAGPIGKTGSEGISLWNLMPRKDDSQNKYATRIRVNLFIYIPRRGGEADKLNDGKGWIIDFGMKYNSTAAVVERDNGKLELVSIDNIEVDNGPEA